MVDLFYLKQELLLDLNLLLYNSLLRFVLQLLGLRLQLRALPHKQRVILKEQKSEALTNLKLKEQMLN